jgi:REP element-mobilizing transposase RayT
MEEHLKHDDEGLADHQEELAGNREGLAGNRKELAGNRKSLAGNRKSLAGNRKGMPRRRKSIRLKGYDYSQEGLYFITICCQDMKHRFGKILHAEMILNEYGQIAHDEWMKLPDRFPNIALDAFQIMPNHMHGIIALTTSEVRSTLAVDRHSTLANPPADLQENALENPPADFQTEAALQELRELRAGASPAPTAPTAPTIGDIVGAYKSIVFNKCLDLYKLKNQRMGKLWLRNYYEHIIRDDRAYQNIANYIINNPIKWGEDKFYKK